MKLSCELRVLPEQKFSAAEIWHGDVQIAEISTRDGETFEITIYGAREDPVTVPVQDFVDVLKRAEARLRSDIELMAGRHDG